VSHGVARQAEPDHSATRSNEFEIVCPPLFESFAKRSDDRAGGRVGDVREELFSVQLAIENTETVAPKMA